MDGAYVTPAVGLTVKLSLCLTKHYVMKGNGGSNV
jgi:hypothetical protein